MLPTSRTTYGLSFLVALLVANVSGPQYVYPTFGTILATKFGWSALENSLVSTACFVGVSFSGPLCSWAIEHWGIPNTLRVAATLSFLGPFLLAQTSADRLPGHFGLCAVYLAMTGMAAAAAYLCALDSQSRNFRAHRGMSLGLTSASLGLCGLVFSQINDHFFKSDNAHPDVSTTCFLLFFASAMASGMFLGSFILGPLEDDRSPDNETGDEVILAEDGERQPLLKGKHGMTDPSSVSGLALLVHPVGFALYTALFVALGIGYVYLANIGQILLALPSAGVTNPQHVRNAHVSLFSLANCGARAFFGTLSDTLKHRYGIHRLWIFWTGVLGLMMSLIWLVTCVSNSEALLPCTAVVAIAYGIAFGVAPAATAEFGTDVFARNWGWLLYAPAFGSQLFNLLFGVLYDQEASKQGRHLCKGVACFQHTFLVGIAASALCLVVLTWALVKMRLYKTNTAVSS